MKAQFEKTQFNNDFDHQAEIVETFKSLGFEDIKIETSMTNGVSHYITINNLKVLNEEKLYSEMVVFEGETFINVRISDHTSNLDTICNGVSGNQMNLNAFKNLIRKGAICSKK